MSHFQAKVLKLSLRRSAAHDLEARLPEVHAELLRDPHHFRFKGGESFSDLVRFPANREQLERCEGLLPKAEARIWL